MMFTFTGPQCSGKSTLLQACKKHYDSRLTYVEEVTRLIKREFDVPINEEGACDITQTLILNKEFENLFIGYKLSGFQGILHDRCLLDGMIYTNYFAEKYGRNKFQFSEALGARYYYSHIHRYDHIFYTNPHDVPMEDDGERSTCDHFRSRITSMYENFWLDDINIRGKVTILRGTVAERMEQIKAKLHELLPSATR